MSEITHENIAVHYFSVKVLALLAGFSEEEAQTIAELCQFVGDNHVPVELTVGTELPALLRRGLAILNDDNTVTVRPRLTGLSQAQWFDKTTLNEATIRRERLVPFHMLPPESPEQAEEYYMTAVDSVIFDTLADQAEQAAAGNRACLLARAGILCHLLFDMHCHKHMCGFSSAKSPVSLVEAREDRGRTDVTKQYADAGKSLPNVGSARLHRALDNCWLNVTYAIGSVHAKPYQKNNSASCATAAGAVHSLLLRLNGHGDEEFSLREKFIDAYRVQSAEYGALKEKWTALFIGGSPPLFLTEFHYSADDVRDALTGGAKGVEGPERFALLTEFLLALEDVLGGVYAGED